MINEGKINLVEVKELLNSLAWVEVDNITHLLACAICGELRINDKCKHKPDCRIVKYLD